MSRTLPSHFSCLSDLHQLTRLKLERDVLDTVLAHPLTHFVEHLTLVVRVVDQLRALTTPRTHS